MMRSAAMAIVCKPLEQKRFTVIPGTLSGKPARRAMVRAKFSPCTPSGMAQPMMTSSISAGSSAPFTFCKMSRITTVAISSERVLRVVPFFARPTAVLLPATITASLAILFSPFICG
jgi:hypothetical protein